MCTTRLREIFFFVSLSNRLRTGVAAADAYAEQRFGFYRRTASAAAAQNESQFVIRSDNSRSPQPRGKGSQIYNAKQRAGSLETCGFKLSFWVLLGLRPKVPRARKREIPSRSQARNPLSLRRETHFNPLLTLKIDFTTLICNKSRRIEEYHAKGNFHQRRAGE